MTLLNKYYAFIILSFVLISCNGQSKNVRTNSASKVNNENKDQKIIPLPENGFYCGFLDSKGNLWFGTNGAGVYQYDGKSFVQHLSKIGKIYEDGQQHNIVLSIVEDLKGNLWFTSLSHGGVSVYDGKEFKHYINELSDDFIRIAYCDSKGNILIGTHGNHNGGLDLYNGKDFKTFHKTNDGLSTNNVRCIFKDDNGEFWIGSGNSPLSVFDGEHFRTFEGNQGQEYDRIIFILEDSDNNIWFGNRNGLWKFNGKEVIEITQA